MKITDKNGNDLNINVDTVSATIDVSVNNSVTVELDLQTVESLLPSLTAAKEALIEVTKNKRKMMLDDLRQQVADLLAQIAEIEAE